MILEKRFLKSIPIGHNILPKLLNFEKQLLDAGSMIRELPAGFWVRKINNTNIFKFRLNNSDRILFTFNSTEEIVFLRYVTHDKQVREAINLSESNISTITLDTNKYEEDNTDIQLCDEYKEDIDLTSIEGYVIQDDEQLTKLVNNPDAVNLLYLSKEQHAVIEQVNNASILLGGAAGTGKTLVLLHTLYLASQNLETLYLTHTELLVDKAKEDYNSFNSENVQFVPKFMTVKQLFCQLTNKSENKLKTTVDIYNWLVSQQKRHKILKQKDTYEIIAEIRGMIKGYIGLENSEIENKKVRPLLSLEAYLNLPIDYSTFDEEEKEQIYKVATSYQSWLESIGDYDENDLAREILCMEDTPLYSMIVVDEVQDLTELQIHIISKLTNRKIVWTGDSNQIIHPTFFNFGRLKNLYYSDDKDLNYLTLTRNYRSTIEITSLLNNITECRQRYIERSKYDYKDIAFRNGSAPFMLDFQKNEFTKLFNVIGNKHYCAVVVGSERTKVGLEKKYPAIKDRLFLVEEIKGLEYLNVYCYNLMSDYISTWKQILANEFEDNKYVKYYFNLLYVGMSRAKDNLYVYEEHQPQVDFELFTEYETIIAYSHLEQMLEMQSTVEDWGKEAKRLTSMGQSQKAKSAIVQAEKLTKTPEDYYKLGELYELEGDFKKAFKNYETAANKGYANAQYKMGECHEEGKGVRKNKALAGPWYAKAAKQGNIDAKVKAGIHYSTSSNRNKQQEGFGWLLEAAEQGHADAQYNLGVCYDSGEGIAEDKEEAVKWFKKAGEQGHLEAQFNLGICYHFGKGVAEDKEEAVKWFKKAAEQGHADAQNNLGLCYARGEGVAKDKEEGVKWIKKAAEQGHPEAIDALNELSNN
ncbi:MAG: hypothetical protein ATN35_10785 [Epulopiscium sp. Nele67-Bin004]|nr:MAG: hypothetical protein ATN35_10785 [Epulopiscium sp. Nele67-Bin004]